MSGSILEPFWWTGLSTRVAKGRKVSGKSPQEFWLRNCGNLEDFNFFAKVFLQKHITGNFNIVENKTMQA